jgi:hypothetical protein
MKITTPLEGNTVRLVFQDCMVKPGEDKSRGVSVSNILRPGSFSYFDKSRLEANRAAISNLLDQLSDQFRTREGASFSELTIDHRGIMWNRIESVLEQLVLMGVATGEVIVGDVTNWSSASDGRPNVQILSR